MRKLMTAVAAAATSLFAFGAVGDFTHTGFEPSRYVAGEVLDTQKDDAGYSPADASNFAKVWEGYGAGTNASTVVRAYDNDAPVIEGKSAGSNYLYVETDEAPVTRYVKQGAAAETIGSTGIYLDTLVKFTPMDADDEASLATTEGDKIAIALVGNETNGTTNFVVRAGYVDGSSIIPTNYTMNAVAENFDYSAWHRLIVEAISDVGNENAPVGFVVYVDRTMLTYSADVAAGDAAYVGSFNGVVKENLYTSSKHALLPSLALKGSNNYGALTSVSFKGNGSVDDIQFTDARPTVLPDYGTIVTIEWDEGVATVKIGDDEAFATAGLGYTSTNITVDAGVTSLAVEADYKEGKEAGEWTASAGTFANGTWTDFVKNATLTINSMTPLFKVGDKNYGDFKSALDAAKDAGAPATIQLLSGIEQALYFDDGEIILDLNGKTIQSVADEDEYSIVNSGATLTIIDSGSNGTVAVPTGAAGYGALKIDDDTAITTIEGGIFAGVVSIDTEVVTTATAVLFVKGGQFLDVDYDPSEQGAEFYLAKNVDTALYSISGPDAEGYFTVSSGVTPEPTEIDVPTAVSDLVYDGTVLTGVAEGTGYTLSGNTATDAGNYTATATLADGYVWTGGSTGEQTINWSIAPKTDAAVVVSLTSEIAEYSAQLEFPTASATIGGDDVAGTPTWNPAEITEPNAGETNTYTVTFAVTTANYAGSTGTATFKVWKAKSEEPVYPSYIDGDDAAAKGKYDTWKSYVEEASETVGDGEKLADAYLLNCKPSEVEAAKAAFKFTSISYDATQKKWVATTTTSYNEREFNGTVTVKQYSDVGCTTESETGTFFKAVLQ